MAGKSRVDGEDLAAVTEIDTSRAHIARVYDYLLGGDNNFAVDREAAEQGAAAQGGLQRVRGSVRTHRAFLGRVVRHLASELGIRQFLDIGTGIPNAGNVHTVAQEAAPDTSVVYVDNDPVVLAHAHELLRGRPEGATDYLQADLRDPEKILEQADVTLDFGKPVAILLLEMLHLFSDDEDPQRIVARLLEAVPPGSYLVVSHLSDDFHPDETRAMARRYNEQGYEKFALRGKTDVARFFDGLEVLDPGVVQIEEWYPHGEVPSSPPREWISPVYVAVGRKP